MTTRWRPEFDPQHLYFLTTTAAQRTHIFQRDIIKRILLDTLHHTCLMNRVHLYAFVLMPNHIHAIIQCPPDCSPADWTRAFKTQAAQLIIRHYQVQNNHQALDAIAALVTRPKKQAYKIWEDGYLVKSVASPGFLEQKLTYIHNNPVQPQWQLVNEPEGYAWSSARFYIAEGSCLIPIRDVRDLLA